MNPIPLAAIVLGPLLAAGMVPPETTCVPVADLVEASDEDRAPSIERVPSDLVESGGLSRWSADTGDTLVLKVRAVEPGTYAISISAVHDPEGPTLSARLWGRSLTIAGAAEAPLGSPGEPRVVDVTLDPVSMGPGHHLLELEAITAGDALLDCVALRRIGEATARRPDPAAAGAEPAFLGVELGTADRGGVGINRAIPETAASRAGIEAGDVVMRFDGSRTETADGFRDAILSRNAGDRVEIELLRGEQRLTLDVELGERPARERSERAAHVIDVLGVRPGQVIADIGCGSGWLSEAIAEEVGPEGTVYAVELRERHIRRLHRVAPANLVPVLSVPDDPFLPARSLDTAMLHDVASHITQAARPRFYENLTRSLKPDGLLVVFGPHGRARRMLDQLDSYGFIPVDREALASLSAKELDEQLQAGIVFRPDRTREQP